MSTTNKATPPIQSSSFTPGQPIPTPANFPVKWTSPDQARLLWTLDRLHFPDPLPPLVASLGDTIYAAPFNKVADQYILPIRLATLPINTYLYLSFTPLGLPPDFALKAINALGQVAPGLVNGLMDKMVNSVAAKYMAQLEPVIARLDDYWTNHWLPELNQHLAYWTGFDLKGATLPQLWPHFEESLHRIGRVWEIHFQIIVPSFLTLHLFHELHHQLWGDDDPLAAFRLLQGFDNKYLEADRSLWQLSRQALTLPKVQQTLTTQKATEVLATLEESPEGQVFLAELHAYLAEYGQRSHKGDGLSGVSWLEEPTPIIRLLQDYLTQPDRDLEAELRAQAIEREQEVAQTRERLQNQPQPVSERFETLLQAAQVATRLHEEHNYWIDQRCLYRLRRVIQAIGQALAGNGALAEPDDIFYLTLDELRAMAQPGSKPDKQAVLAARRAELAFFRTITPPPALGTMPLMTPPDDPFGRSLTKIYGAPLIPTGQVTPSQDEVICGHAGSPGVAAGRARIIRSLTEAHKLQRGEVLVAETTTPPWTPLFVTVSAIVTDVGGILSHATVVAREYRIPAVVGTGIATATIHDGQMLEVDGNTGIVRMLDGS